MTKQSYSVETSSLRAFAQELQAQLDGLAKPMNTLASQSSSQPQFGGFTEAQTLGQSQQAAIQQMSDLLSQVKQAVGFAENVTTKVATAYENTDRDAAAGYQGGSAASGSGNRVSQGG